MKRESKAGGNDICTCTPWFVWRECCNCKKEFTREAGWRAFVGPFHGSSGTFRYICGECAPDMEAANSIIDSQPWLPPRPDNAPPAPPRSR